MPKKRDDSYDLLRERALDNFDILLSLWNIEFQKIGDYEYDFLSPTRKDDANFGACRFNVHKGLGADFAGISFNKEDFESIGPGFSKEDFSGYGEYGESQSTFDVIGLCQRTHKLSTYTEGADKLKSDLDKIDGGNTDVAKLHERAASRHEEIRLKKEKMRNFASKMWSYCRDVSGTIAENYLVSRNIHIGDCIEPNMKFHGKTFNKELGIYIPAVIFKVSKTHDGELQAIHRVWIAKDGSRKAHLQETKMALGSVVGNAIWFGQPDKNLYILEGPENALYIRHRYKRKFVASTVYSTNYHSLAIPEYVKTVILIPDPDAPGWKAAARAKKEYEKQNKEIIIMDVRNLIK